MLLSGPMRLARLAVALPLGLLAIVAALPGASLGEEGGYLAIRAADDYFDAEVTRVAVGTTVEWTNVGRNPHTVTADDGSYDSGDMQPVRS